MCGLHKNLTNKYAGPPHSRAKIYAARMSLCSSSYRSIYAARARPQQQTRCPPLLLSIYRTERRTDGRTLDRFMTLTACYADRVINVGLVRLYWTRDEWSSRLHVWHSNRLRQQHQHSTRLWAWSSSSPLIFPQNTSCSMHAYHSRR